VGRGPSRLSDVISDIVRTVIETGGESLASLESLSEATLSISREIGLDIKASNNSLETIKEHGRLIAENYRIRQFVLLANKDQLRQLSEKF
jgi:hypothetical protein